MSKTVRISVSVKEIDKEYIDFKGLSPSKFLQARLKDERIKENDVRWLLEEERENDAHT